jgi:tetratricopeptide (TPR) repeat protein
MRGDGTGRGCAIAAAVLAMAPGAWADERGDAGQGLPAEPSVIEAREEDPQLPGMEAPAFPELPDADAFLDVEPEPPAPRVESSDPAGTAARPEVRALVREGFLEMRVENHEAAAAAFRRALALDPENARIKFGLGTALIAVGAFGEAVELLESLAVSEPEDYAVLNNLGWLFATAADPRYRDGDRALDYARRALILAPQDFHVWSTMSEAYYISGRYREAVRAAEHALQLARRRNSAPEVIRDYERRVVRARQAAEAFEILE